MEKDEALINQNKIVFKNNLRVEKKRKLKYELKSIIPKKPNRKFLGLFRTRLSIYNRTQQDSLKKFRKWMHTKIGEPPVIFDSLETEQTAQAMKNYLNNKGYFNADVQSGTAFNNKKNKVGVSYSITTNNVYQVDSVSYRVSDPSIRTILESQADRTLLKEGVAVDNNLFDSEKNRITRSLRNNGYAYFTPNFVKFKSFDSSHYKVDVSTFILQPTDTSNHETYRVGEVYIHPGYYAAVDSDAPYDTLVVDGYKFLYREKMGIRTKPILNSVFISRGELYNQDDYDATRKKLGNLGIYKFVSIRYFRNPDNPNELDFFIYLTPNKKLVLGYDFEINTSNGSALGTALSVNHSNRNIFKGGEILSINVEGGVEFGFNNDATPLNRLDIGTQFGLLFPKWIVPFKIKTNPRHSPKTNLSLEYNFLDERLYYKNSNFSASFGYEWQPKPTIKHVFNPVSLNFLKINEIRELFQDIVDNNPFIANSFNDQFFLGGNYSFIYATPFQNLSSTYFRTNLETTGNAISLLDRIIQPDVNFQPFNIDYSQYLKLDADFRYYRKISRRSTLATRFYIGSGFGYGNADEVPYVKQFFAGGTTSMRGWKFRELGPGAYIDTLLLNPSIQPYQAADFKMEANAEFRFDMISYFEGAFFIDVGNIWTLSEDNRGREALFTSDFLSQLAINAGFGLRLDFSYFIIRLDLAYKLRNPYRFEDSGSHWIYANKPFNITDAVLNLAIGYPF